jgi:hypothetical protein
MLKFIGKLICGTVLAVFFLGLGILSAMPYGGGYHGLFALAGIMFIFGIVWAVVGLLDELLSGTESYRALFETKTKPARDAFEPTSQLLTESAPILEAVDIQQFIKTASKRRIHLANADRPTVYRFFYAIRYRQMDLARKLLSDNPLLILTQDADGNTPLAAAVQENYSELQSFFQECLK